MRFDERAYAAFSLAFERAATEEIMRHDPASTVVLSNDVSEGPDFAALARRGFRVFTIYHVDVVAYVAEIYGRGWIRPETTVRWYPRLRYLLPDITKLDLGEAGRERALFPGSHHAFRGNAGGHAALLSRLRAGENSRASLGRLVVVR